jgi:hypothetical protein
VAAETTLHGRTAMKLRFALIALATLGGAALSAGTASAMPVAPLGTNASNVETVALSAVPAVVSAPSPPIAIAQLLSADPMLLAAITVAAIAGTDLREGFGPLFCETLAL